MSTPSITEKRDELDELHRAIETKQRTAYTPGFWRWISLIVRMLPARFVKF